MDILNDLKTQIASYYDEIIVLIPQLGLAIILSLLFLLIMGFFRKKLLRYINNRAEDKLRLHFLDGVFKIVNISIGFLIFLYIMGQVGIVQSLLGAATISSIVIGFAFKDIVENFLAGVIMAFNRPFRLGDTIKIGEVEGSITEMSLRDTHLKTFDGKDVYIPNSHFIKNPLYNYTIDGYLRGNFTVAVDYHTDVDKTRAIILDVVNSIPGVLSDKKKSRTHVKNINANTINIEVHYWINTFDDNYSGLEIKSQAQSKVMEALLNANVVIPIPTVQLKNKT